MKETSRSGFGSEMNPEINSESAQNHRAVDRCASSNMHSGLSIGWLITNCAGLESSFLIVYQVINWLSSAYVAPSRRLTGQSTATCLSTHMHFYA